VCRPADIDRLREEPSVNTFAQSEYWGSKLKVPRDLPHAGSTLENPYVFDATARELKQMASRGLVEILDEATIGAGQDTLISRLRFQRLR
jgi:hypothetical protein